MKFLLVYYTGTYNTRYLSDEISKLLVESGHTVDKVEINIDPERPLTKDMKLIVIAHTSELNKLK